MILPAALAIRSYASGLTALAGIRYLPQHENFHLAKAKSNTSSAGVSGLSFTIKSGITGC